MSEDRNIARVTATAAVHAGRTVTNPTPPIDLSATYYLPGVDAGGESYEALVAGGAPTAEGGLVYQRMWNPTTAGFERALAELEGLPEAVSFASGMAAITACLLAATATKAADGKRHIIALRPIYGGTDGLLTKGTLGTEVTWVDGPADIAAALAARPDTALVVVETPANPTAQLLDLDAVAEACGDVPYLVDSTFATPVLQQPARHGATLVVHSATKYLGGHCDVLGGVVATTPEWAARLRDIRVQTGGLLHPIAGYLLHRGLQTLPLRVKRSSETAQTVAEWLVAHPAVERVYYPGLPGGDPDGLIGPDKQMLLPGAMLAFSMRGGYDAAAAVAENVRLILHAASLGGAESLITHPASLSHRHVAPNARPDAGLLRFSVGLEDAEDLVGDLEAAFTKI
ncbi:Cystathionine gamma-synthase [Catenulispora acidiphila DSM 44928]|uniref:homocysteine desulfhydrase n=1 Tax=Catenulispora acidiphila (strain DSM 44928 / JCM 14897 / NBRC 102108 / NRRL B-24433 / ID139908) TaxID=479433 RepID=C7QH71_CATAD|nr:PLP-dependent transferase [Catenulispora acidiphila]ACU76921.1 Cystathionine gamma-synthase [Catenulispora acidiphila DSM 44928]